MIIWIYRNYIFISIRFAFNPACSWCDYWWMPCASTRRHRYMDQRAANSSGRSTHPLLPRSMQIRHAKSSHRHKRMILWFFKRKIFAYSKFIPRDLLLLFLSGWSFRCSWWHYLLLRCFHRSRRRRQLLSISFALPEPNPSQELTTYTQQNANETD